MLKEIPQDPATCTLLTAITKKFMSSEEVMARTILMICMNWTL